MDEGTVVIRLSRANAKWLLARVTRDKYEALYDADARKMSPERRAVAAAAAERLAELERSVESALAEDA